MELKRDFKGRTEKGRRTRETSQQGNHNVVRVPTMSWNMQMQFSMPGKVTGFFLKINQSFGKVLKFDRASYELAEFFVVLP